MSRHIIKHYETRRPPGARAFLKNILGWTLINDPRVNQMTEKLREAIKERGPAIRFSYAFMKYSRYSVKKGKTVYGLALVGWRHYHKYTIAPNLYSYFEKEDLKLVDQIIDNILKDFDNMIEMNLDFVDYYDGVFVIPASYYYQ